MRDYRYDDCDCDRPLFGWKGVAVLLLAAGAFLGYARWASAADLPLKAPLRDVPVVTCAPAGPCTGWEIGGHVETAGTSFDILGSGLGGLQDNGGIGIGAHVGYQFWNGQFLVGAEVGGTWYTGSGSLLTTVTNADPRWSVDYTVKLGYALFGAISSTSAPPPSQGPLPSFPQLAALMTTPYIEIGGRTRNFGTGLYTGVGVQFAIGNGWNLEPKYFHVQYDKTSNDPTMLPTKIGSEQGLRLEFNRMF